VGLERRLLQLAIALGSLVPILAGGAGMLSGAEIVRGTPTPAPPDLDSHFRYLSGLLFGIGIGFLSCIPRIEEQGARFRLLGAIVLVGGIGRALSLSDVGPPGLEHQLALGMELVTMPLLLLWQWRVAKSGAGGQPGLKKAKGPPDLVRRPL
jgi:hypothetical protein